MNPVVHLLRQLEAYVQEEIGAQGRTLALLGAQEDALRSRDPHKITSSTQQLERELSSAPRRAQRRQELLAAFARAWDLAPCTLTLSSVVDRAGEEGERLARQRNELRAVTANVARQSRRVAAIARYHESFATDVLQVLIAVDGGAPFEAGGVLVDAEA